jgi:phosphatidylinositol-3-phosphatase
LVPLPNPLDKVAPVVQGVVGSVDMCSAVIKTERGVKGLFQWAGRCVQVTKRVVFIAISVLVVVGVTLPLNGGTGSIASASGGTCGTMPVSSTHYQHVIWVWMENHSSSTVIGSDQAPYINSLVSACGLATNYHNISHPSLPNYIAATSGLPLSSLSVFSGDCNVSRRCSTTAPSIFGQGESWRAYEESMPSDCARRNSGEYAIRHNPPPYYRKLAFCKARRAVRHGPKVSFDVPYGQLAANLATNSLPAFSFITPNLIDDMHDGSLQQGDTWLSQNLPSIFNSAEYRAGQVVVFVTWDEGEGGSSNNCATNTSDIGCSVATMVASPSTPMGTESGVLFNHYSLLLTTEELLRLPALGQAATANSMVSAFNL